MFCISLHSYSPITTMNIKFALISKNNIIPLPIFFRNVNFNKLKFFFLFIALMYSFHLIICSLHTQYSSHVFRMYGDTTFYLWYCGYFWNIFCLLFFFNFYNNFTPIANTLNSWTFTLMNKINSVFIYIYIYFSFSDEK